MGTIEVDLFSEDVDGADHLVAVRLKGVLEKLAEEYHCRLQSFDVERGVVSFAFDSEVLTAEILKILQAEKTTER